MDFPVPMRKRNRLQDYDYSQGGAYYVTICAQYKKCLFGYVIDGPDGPIMQVNELGRIVEAHIRAISDRYPTIEVVRACVMPNHVHLLLFFDPEKTHPALSMVINQFKGAASKSAGKPLWQKGYYDHVIRDEAEYRQIGSYIEHNAAKWKSDDYYTAAL